jgi:hypothetical protein
MRCSFHHQAEEILLCPQLENLYRFSSPQKFFVLQGYGTGSIVLFLTGVTFLNPPLRLIRAPNQALKPIRVPRPA